MSAIRKVLAVLALGSMVLATAAPAAAAQPTTYRGIFAGPVVYDQCSSGVAPVGVVASGTWKVSIHDDQATMEVNIWRDGRHHLSFGGVFDVTQVPAGELLTPISTQMGTLHVGLVDTAFSYWLEDYSNLAYDPPLECASVTYPGFLTGVSGD
jgi:hypothetical protein